MMRARVQVSDDAGAWATAYIVWSVVFDTANTETALKLLGRVLARIEVTGDIQLAPWGESRDRRVATLAASVPDVPNRSDLIAYVMSRAATVSATWTLDLTDDPVNRTLFQGWTPLEYRRFSLEGMYAASFVVRSGSLSEHAGRSSGRMLSLRDGTVVRVLDA